MAATPELHRMALRGRILIVDDEANARAALSEIRRGLGCVALFAEDLAQRSACVGLVDDEANARAALSEILREEGYATETAADLAQRSACVGLVVDDENATAQRHAMELRSSGHSL